MKVLANDGISQSGINALQEANFDVITKTVAQEQLEDYINNEEITVLLVRSAGHEVTRSRGHEVRGTRYEVSGTRSAVRGTRSEVRGTR